MAHEELTLEQAPRCPDHAEAPTNLERLVAQVAADPPTNAAFDAFWAKIGGKLPHDGAFPWFFRLQ